ncbi:MAG: transglycosylase SLT domain-containing protein [Bdellovibrionota bacterium]
MFGKRSLASILIISASLFVVSGAFADANSVITSKKPAYRPNFTSPVYKKVIIGTDFVSSLPGWHGFHFWKASVGEVVIPQLNGWTEHLHSAISKDGGNLIASNPRQIKYFCPKYEKLDREHRIAFWARLISLMSAYESSYNPKTTYKEPKMGVLSSGLMQISHGSSQQDEYRCTMISADPKQGQLDLLDPKKNLSCAVRIINHFIGHDKAMSDYLINTNGKYWVGLARYWGVFRHGTIRSNEDSFWSQIGNRQKRWQAAASKRDEHLLLEYRSAVLKGLDWGHMDWKAKNSSTPHPSLLEDVFDKEESHPLTGILRQINQTGFCFR